MTEDLAARIAMLEDRVAIEELVAVYTLHAAAAEVEKLVDLFTEDGVFHAHSGAVRGRDELTRFFANALVPGKTVPIVGQMHMKIEGDMAWLKCLMATTFHEGRPGGFCGYYDDELRRAGGGWKFASRNFRFYHQA